MLLKCEPAHVLRVVFTSCSGCFHSQDAWLKNADAPPIMGRNELFMQSQCDGSAPRDHEPRRLAERRSAAGMSRRRFDLRSNGIVRYPHLAFCFPTTFVKRCPPFQPAVIGKPLVVARQRQAHIYANICVLPKRHQFAGSLHKSLGAPETKDERQNVWEEVCRRAKATVEECKRIGCPLREGVSP